MSQLSLSIPSVPSFPPLSYRETPVLTTEMLAQAYGVAPHQIRQNFKNNRERFIEGKHFFLLSGSDLKEFKNCVENFYSVQIGKRTASVTLYTDRGCARHAKSLNTDRAWDMYELLEETFFAVVKTEQPAPSPISKRTDPERKALTAIINTWVGMAPIHYASARAQVNAHFGVTSVDALTVAQVKEAIQWVQAKIDALPAVPAPVRTPALAAFNVYRDRVKELERLEQEWIEFAGETRSRLHQFVKELLRVKGSTYPELLNRVCPRQNISKDPLLGILQSNSYNAQTWIDEGISAMRAAIRAAKTANRMMLG